MFVKKGEVVCIASGYFESYERNGSYVVARDFDLSLFTGTISPPNMTPLEAGDFMREVSGLLIAQGLLVKMPCRNIYLGAFGEFNIGEEGDTFT